MSDTAVLPELKQIIGALLFAAREPIAIDVIHKTLRDAAKQYEGPVQDFGKAGKEDIEAAIKELNDELVRAKVGIHVGEVANGFRLQNDLNCGIWIRQMLEKGRSNRLSKPALETLAIIAYRQPCTRAEIESVRGVAVDAILKNLMEMQLVKAAGRSELPGRPWLFATTQKFLEYFGLKNVQDLPGIEELRRMEKAQAEAKRNEAIEKAVAEEEKKQSELPLNENEHALADDPVAQVDDDIRNNEEKLQDAEAIDNVEDPDEEEYDDEDDDEEYDDEEYDDEDEDDDEDWDEEVEDDESDKDSSRG
ncbi:MAG TPA: SMC-Scp complex subunit ScpB [Kiritimatiellia bacterium]|nr:SMC-Scp complex subunit ScpB [Kiritimatiellia bacterium]